MSFNSLLAGGIFLSLLVIHHQAANVASRGIATQSAEPADAANGPNMAIDENTRPLVPRETCALVPTQNDPWWQLDLRSIYRITAVSIFSIGDCCHEQLNGAEIRIGLRNDTSNQRCAVVSVVQGQRIYDYECGIMEGRFVHVVLPGQWRSLTVCEVQVFGAVLGKPSMLSSPY
ncbi:pentraxin fusion protein-like isoform X2 [Parambassis ranga]|uniref:Pentraxin fusion protein-like isoform X2 n=1 Tax=Parambassis ranga TaxID=210632 RepID=A0A6P7IAB7_9TELE|nr:pentraxin fusion protein-like isoform X2 [Parambassis ranga]